MTMAAGPSIELSGWLDEQLAQASPVLLRGMVKRFAEALMGAEADAICGAGYGERSVARVTNGYRSREWDTRAGTEPVAFSAWRCREVRAGRAMGRLDGQVAKQFLWAQRDQPFLLPVDMRDWLPSDHVVWVLLEVIDHLDVSGLEARYALGGAGRRAFDPRMLLTLLIYSYSGGIRSSRQIERLCRTDLAMRMITGMRVPDHTVIARFRQRHQDSVRELFTQVLLVCAKAGLGSLGTIAIDGTKIAANASRHATCRREWLQQQVDEIVAQAAAQDAAEDAVRDEQQTPWQRRGRRDREARLRRALAEVLAEEAERGLDAESVAAKEQAFIKATRAGRNDVGSRPVGADPLAIAEARVQAARDRLEREKAVKREEIAVMRERIRRFDAGEEPKPVLGQFSFDENRGREVARAGRWLARAARSMSPAAVCRNRCARTAPSPARRAASRTMFVTPLRVRPTRGGLTRRNTSRAAVRGWPRRRYPAIASPTSTGSGS
jgi:transposase